MESCYYVFSPAGHAPRHKHETFDEAVTESRRLCEMHPNQTFEVLQRVAITSAPKPQVSTSYMDGVLSTQGDTDKDEQYVGFPDGMELPEIPYGYRQAIYRGIGWKREGVCFGFAYADAKLDWDANHDFTNGSESCHYCEFIK
jgi:hypothetical protein